MNVLIATPTYADKLQPETAAAVKAQKFAGKTCVEIGTLKGLTAIVLARHFERVISIDIVDDPQKYEIAAMLNVRNVEFVNVRNNAEKAEVIEAVPRRLRHRFA